MTQQSPPPTSSTPTTDSTTSTDRSSGRSQASSTRTRRGGKQADPINVQPPPTTTNASPPASSPFVYEDPLIVDINTNLRQYQWFLSNSDLVQSVLWVESGRQLKLVQKPDTPGKVMEPAVLQWVGEISPSNFWLYPCAGWNGAKGPKDDWSSSSPFEKAKSRAHIRSPN